MSHDTVYRYTLGSLEGCEAYDEAVLVTCLQALLNRERPVVYLLSETKPTPRYWYERLSVEGRWLEGKRTESLQSLDDMWELAGEHVRGAVIWDTAVPATVNVATTIAGVENAVVLSPSLAERYEGLETVCDLRSRFDGSESGSAKNDAYRWALREYLAKGACSSRLLCLYEDSFRVREAGEVRYAVTRDRAVKERAFVYDLSPWGDEIPLDDPDQRVGTDLETYRMILEEMLRQSAGEHMTEVAGFFSFVKYSNVQGHESAHDPVPTEWETVHLISPYNCYQNTVAHDCFNQSFHCHAPLSTLKQRRPASHRQLGEETYVCFHMADYDSATPLYEFLPRLWDDPTRGEVPLAWGVNPNLVDAYPDIIAYLYETATPNDHFVADASAAGYFNPNRIREEYLPLVVRHNRRFFEQTDMSIAPMVLDWDEPTPEVKDAFTEFSRDGFATIVMDLHGGGGKPPEPHVWKSMPVLEMVNDACNASTPEEACEILTECIEAGSAGPALLYLRIIWKPPRFVTDLLDLMREAMPERGIVAVDPFTFFRLGREYLHSWGR